MVEQPSVAAEPITRAMLIQYANWLSYERRLLCHEIGGQDGRELESCDWLNPADDRTPYPDTHFPQFGRLTDARKPSARAAVVMAAADFDWRPCSGSVVR